MNDDINIIREYIKFNKRTDQRYKDFYHLLEKLNIIKIDDYYKIENHIVNINFKEYYKRYKLAKISAEFVSYLNGKGFSCSTIFNNMYLKKERRVELANYLQYNNPSIDDLAEYFLCDERTIRRDLEALQSGEKINGIETTIKIKRRKNIISLDDSESTVHLVNLNLNLTELYTLLIDISSKIPNNETTYDIYNSIMRRIYSQLTPYAKSIIDKHRDTVCYTDAGNRYISEREMFDSNFKTIYVKAAKSCEFILARFKYKDKIIREKVTVKEIYDNGFSKYILKDEKGHCYECEEKDLIEAQELE